MPPTSRGGPVQARKPLPLPQPPVGARAVHAIDSSSAERPAKRPRLNPTPPKIGKENCYNAILGSLGSQARGPAKAMHKEARNVDEQALLDNLMAGLDASAFDLSSPVKSQQTPVKSQPRTVIKREALSPIKESPAVIARRHVSLEFEQKGKTSRFQPAVKLEPLARNTTPPSFVKRERPPDVAPPTTVKIESLSDRGPKIEREELPAAIKQEVVTETPKEDQFEDELFDFDFDLSDLATLEQDMLRAPAKLRYPILHPAVPRPPDGYKSTPWARCKVKLVLTGLRFEDGVLPSLDGFESTRDQTGNAMITGKTAVVKLTSSEKLCVVHLKERWADLPLRKGDIINIVSHQLDANPKIITISFKDPSSFIIHHPDLMLTMTSIANAMPCPRKPILQSLVKMPGPMSKPMLYGQILHGLLQGSLSDQEFDIDATNRRLNADLAKDERRLEVWSTGLGIEDVKLEVGNKAGKGFETFANKWVGSTPSAQGELHAERGDEPSRLAITGLHDIEEDIWSPKWGMKGKVDASVQASIARPKATEAEENVAPLEIKTGRSVGVMAHRAQTMLYTLLMEDRYGVPVPAGLLYYSQLDSVLRVEAKPNEIRALINTRNELAHHLAQKRSLPELDIDLSTQRTSSEIEDYFLPATIDHSNECKKCYAVDTCMLYRKSTDGVEASSDDRIAELYEEKTGHLKDTDVAFFRKWEGLLTIEEQDTGRFRSQLWTMTAAEREKTGRCFSDMVIQSYSNDLGKSLAKIHRHSYTFVRAAESPHHSLSLLSGHIAKGDPVSLSIEPDLLCLSRGYVTHLTASSITIGVTYIIDPAALLERTKHRGHSMSGDKVLFRIDKDEMTAGVMKMRANLSSLFIENGAENLRRMIVDLRAPEYEPAWAAADDEMPSNFNPDQRAAMNKVLAAREYALVLGMPGTGKTTTIAEIIKCLVARGKSVLLTSYTHSAVDTILMKLVNAEFGVLRLGNIDKVHPDVQHLTLEAMEPSTCMDQLDSRLMSPPVVAATCLSVDHPVFFKRRFDYCIVDEASQITVPTILGPLRMADKFVLVGDHFQLPPIVRHPVARKGGLDVSLFKLLSERHPESVADLSLQYRMNEDIMTLSNRLVYEGRLQCGSEQVAKQSLILRESKACEKIFERSTCRQDCWIQDLLQENVKAVFVDTDRVPGYDSRVGDLVQNEVEANLVQQLSLALISGGLNPSDLAVITPYRQQIKLLTGLFQAMPKVEILTADKSQGRDKDCILISLVRSNLDGSIGDLLKDWRRINVSFTRAKRKLVIFGSRRTMMRDTLLNSFVELMEEKGWVYTLQKGAEGLHRVEETGVPLVKPVKVEAVLAVKKEL